MLYLSRRAGEAVIVNHAIEVRVVEVKGKTVKLGFNFPKSCSVLREEVFLQVQAENRVAIADPDTLAALDGPRARPEVDQGHRLTRQDGRE